MRRALVPVLAGLVLGLGAVRADAADSGPLAPSPRWSPPPVRSSPAPKSAEDRYNEGHAFAQAKEWVAAEAAYRDAIRQRASFPEAWNGLGYALRHQRRYDESVRAYDEALRLRPNYPEALEYLGEAYVQMGRIEEAKVVLERLRPLDPKEAEVLSQAITAATTRR